MRFPSPGRFRTFETFQERWREIAPDLGCDEAPGGAESALARPFVHAGRTLANRFAVHPMEGWDGTPEGLPSENTLRRWRNFGRSGARLVWGGEAFAVRADGRANPNQLFLNDEADAAGGLATLLAELHAGHAEIGEDPAGLLVGLQLTHSGRHARPLGAPAPRIAWHDPRLDAHGGIAPDLVPLTDGELEGIAERFVRAAVLAREVGFDFVDVKCCHGYLLHELLGATGRPGRYGGSFQNRTRFVLEVIAAIQSACPGLEVAVRVSLADVAPHRADPETGVGIPSTLPATGGFGMDREDPLGIDLAEGLGFLGLLRQQGVRLVNVTLGSPYSCPHLQRPAAFPPSDGYEPPRDPLHEVATHLRVVRACRRTLPELVLVGTGYSYLQEWLPHVAHHEVAGGHVDLVGLGRMMLSYPELPLDVLAGRTLDRRRICRTFSDCTTAPRNGLVSGCYPLDPHYRGSPEGARLEALKRRKRRKES